MPRPPPGRLVEAVQQLTLALAERARPGALILCYDDVQWTDLATRDLLLYRLPRQHEAGAPQLLLLTVRSEALASAPELERWLVCLARQVPTTRLSLGPLAQAETAQALAAVLADANAAGGEREPQVGAWLYAQTAGQPFFLIETLRALVERGLLVPRGRDGVAGADAGPLLALAPGVERWSPFVPDTVRGLIRGQLGGLSPAAQELLAAAAVLGPCYHFVTQFERPQDIDIWQAAAEGKPVDWPALFADFQAAVDWPASLFYTQLMALYPDAKVLLNVRDPEAWYASMAQTVYPASQAGLSAPAESVLGRMGRMVNTLAWQPLFHGRFEEKPYALSVFERHNQQVKDSVPADRLLVWEVTEGWEPLCRFLDLPAPVTPFPHLNDAQTFREQFLSHVLRLDVEVQERAAPRGTRARC